MLGKGTLFCMLICVTIVQAYSQTENKKGDRDTTWKWWVNEVYSFNYNSTKVSVRLPIFENNHPATSFLVDNYGSSQWDYYPNQGWVLLLRNFETNITDEGMPFFLLYNKYRGILRLFYLPRTANSGYTRAIGHLKFQNENNQVGLLNLGYDNIALDNYQSEISNYSQTSYGEMIANQWCIMDFNLSGYDPYVSSKTDPTIEIDIYGQNVSNVTLEGTVEPQGMSQNNNLFKDLSKVFGPVNDGLQKVTKNYKSKEDAKKSLDDMADEEKKGLNRWWADLIKGVTSSGFPKAIGFIDGVLDLIVKGSSGSMVIKKYDLKISGTITQDNHLGKVLFRVPGSRHVTASADVTANRLPLYDVPLGLFNIKSLPTLHVYCDHRRYYYASPQFRTVYGYYGNIEDFTPVFNTHIFKDMDIEFSYTRSDQDIRDYGDIDNMHNIKYLFENEGMGGRNNSPIPTADQIFSGPGEKYWLGFKITLLPKDNLTEETQIIKGYKPQKEFEVFGTKSQTDPAPELSTKYRSNLPFKEDFKQNIFSNSYDKYWTRGSSNQYGRARRTKDNGPYDDNWHFTMDVTTNGNYATNWTDLHINISGRQNVWLSFWLKEFNEETHSLDGLYLSDDGGKTFVKIDGLVGSNSWQQRKYNISQLANENNLSVSPNFVIRFQQYDNFSISTDGIAIDEVRIYMDTYASRVGEEDDELDDVSVNFFVIYPNPVEDQLKISLPKSDQKYVVSIFDMSGRAYMDDIGLTEGNTEVNVSDLPSGVYLLVLEDGANTYKSRFIKN